MEYNTVREGLRLPEYGRHIQKLVSYAQTLEDRAERQDVVEQIIQMMGFLNPNLKNEADFKHKLWDHIFTISNFELECDSPYPKPTPETVYAKPEPLPYPNHRIKYRHYGMNLEAMIKKAAAMEDEEKKAEFTRLIAMFMKRTYSNYNKEGVNDEIIRGDIARISNGELEIAEDQAIRVKTYNNKNKNRRRNNNNNGNNNKNKKRYRR
ncbi:MAG: DUF4290 domain-containing protein [Saprospiraceae bacterium]|nr:DUF4290 domain-containing protein [Saprospiraceae bacterium]